MRQARRDRSFARQCKSEAVLIGQSILSWEELSLFTGNTGRLKPPLEYNKFYLF